MLTLKIETAENTFKLSGVVDLVPTGTIDGYADSGSITLEAPRQLGRDEWSTQFTDKKQKAMMFGGKYPADDHVETTETNLYDFKSGLGKKDGEYQKPYLQTIQHTSPVNGEFWILPGKTVDVSENENEICVSLPVHHKQPDKALVEINMLLWRLYHCINSLNGRLQIFDLTIPKDGNPNISNMGPYFGTYLQYQALIARWNAFAWDSSFMLKVTPAGERATIVLGYTNLNCIQNSEITMSCTITSTRPQASNNGADVLYDATPLTIYNQGSDSNIDISPVTTYKRNDASIGGSGYEGKNPDMMDTASVSVTLPTSLDKTQYSGLKAEQYYRTIVAIAPCVGVDFEYKVQDPDKQLVYYTLAIAAEWKINNIPYTKTATVKITAVGKIVKVSEQ